MQANHLQLLDTVALVEDVPARNLLRGQVGTIVELLDADTFEVEFTDDEGRTYAMIPLRRSQVMRLHYQPFTAA